MGPHSRGSALPSDRVPPVWTGREHGHGTLDRPERRSCRIRLPTRASSNVIVLPELRLEPRANVNDRLLTTRQVTDYFGVASEKVLRRYRRGDLKGIRLGSTCRGSGSRRWRCSRGWVDRGPSAAGVRIQARRWAASPSRPVVTACRVRARVGSGGLSSWASAKWRPWPRLQLSTFRRRTTPANGQDRETLPRSAMRPQSTSSASLSQKPASALRRARSAPAANAGTAIRTVHAAHRLPPDSPASGSPRRQSRRGSSLARQGIPRLRPRRPRRLDE